MKYSVLIAACVAAIGFAAVAEQSDVPVKVEATKTPVAVVATNVVSTNAVKTNVVVTVKDVGGATVEIKKDAAKKVE